MAHALPAPRLIIASNDPTTGRSIISRDAEMKPFAPFGPNTSSFSTLYTTDCSPTNNLTSLPPLETTAIPRPSSAGATVLCTSDIPPMYTSAFHRTQTLDYMAVLKGEIVLRVDEGQEVVVREGDVLVNRGNIHAWVNKTESWCRLLFVMMGAEKVVLEDGKMLEDAFFPPAPPPPKQEA